MRIALMACGALAAAERDGHLPRDPAVGPDARKQRLHKLRATSWVVYAKTPLAGPAAVLDYLSRYTHRNAISHERIVAVRDAGVALRVRGDGHDGKKIVRINGAAFVGCVLQHALPQAFKRIRHYGLLAGDAQRHSAWRRHAPHWRCRHRTRSPPKLRPSSYGA